LDLDLDSDCEDLTTSLLSRHVSAGVNVIFVHLTESGQISTLFGTDQLNTQETEKLQNKPSILAEYLQIMT